MRWRTPGAEGSHSPKIARSSPAMPSPFGPPAAPGTIVEVGRRPFPHRGYARRARFPARMVRAEFGIMRELFPSPDAPCLAPLLAARRFAPSPSTTASSSRRCASTRARTACPTTGTSCTWAAARWAAPRWSASRRAASRPRAASRRGMRASGRRRTRARGSRSPTSSATTARCPRSRSRTPGARPRATSRGWAASRSRRTRAAGRRSGRARSPSATTRRRAR